MVEQHDPPKNVEPTLRKSTRERRSAIPSNYVVYLQDRTIILVLKMILKHFHKS